MSLLKELKKRTRRRVLRIRGQQASRGVKHRITVFRSLNHVYAQIIDDSQHVTVLSYSSLSLKGVEGKKADMAKKVGLELGKLALDKKIDGVFFDRGKYLYHGRVKALAEGLREAGLQF